MLYRVFKSFWRTVVLSFFRRSIKFFRLHTVVQFRYGDGSRLLQKIQIVFMSVKMFYVVFGSLNHVLVLYVVSNSLRLFCVIVVVLKNVVRSVRIFMLFVFFSCQVVWSVLFVSLFQVVVGCVACRLDRFVFFRLILRRFRWFQVVSSGGWIRLGLFVFLSLFEIVLVVSSCF